MSTRKPSRNELFLRGAGSYLDALTALEAFKQEVVHICREVCDRHDMQLAERMGLDAAKWERYDEPDPHERWAHLGVKRPAQPECKFKVYLEWRQAEGGDDELAAVIWLDVYHKNLRDKIYDGFRQKDPGCIVEKYESYSLYAEKPLRFNELGSAGAVLDNLVLKWLRYCKSVGGLKLKKYKTD